MLNKIEEKVLVTHIAAADDSRCKWWQAIIPKLNVTDLEGRADFKYLRANGDYELEVGTLLIDSEEKHHREKRGYRVMLGYVFEHGVEWITSKMERKMYIKSKGRIDLMKGSGDIAGVLRMALYIQSAEDPELAFKELASCK